MLNLFFDCQFWNSRRDDSTGAQRALPCAGQWQYARSGQSGIPSTSVEHSKRAELKARYQTQEAQRCGVITDPAARDYGTQTLANDYVHAFQASLGWTHTFPSRPLNEFHAGTSQDNQIATPARLAPNIPTLILDSPAPFTLGNAPFSVGRVFERQWSLADRADYMIGKHTLHFGFDGCGSFTQFAPKPLRKCI